MYKILDKKGKLLKSVGTIEEAREFATTYNGVVIQYGKQEAMEEFAPFGIPLSKDYGKKFPERTEVKRGWPRTSTNQPKNK